MTLGRKEKADLIKQALTYIEKNSTQKWVESFLKDLKLAYKPTSISYFLGINVAHQFRLINQKNDLRKLNIAEVESCFFNSNKCVIFIDHEALPTIEFGRNTMQPSE